MGKEMTHGGERRRPAESAVAGGPADRRPPPSNLPEAVRVAAAALGFGLGGGALLLVRREHVENRARQHRHDLVLDEILAGRAHPYPAGATQRGSSRASVARGSDPWPSSASWKARRSKAAPSRSASSARRRSIWRWPIL